MENLTAKQPGPYRIIARRPLAGLSVLCLASCASHPVPLVPPASPRTLACVMNELRRMGYSISDRSPGSPWYQAIRSQGAGGDEIWLRLVDDTVRAPWLDLRAMSWKQSPGASTASGLPGSFLVPPPGSQGQEDVRAVLERCAGHAPGDGAA